MTDNAEIQSKNMNELSTDWRASGYAPSLRLFAVTFAVFAFVAAAVLYVLDPMHVTESERFISQKKQLEASFKEMAAMLPETDVMPPASEAPEVTSPLRAFSERYESLRKVVVWDSEKVASPEDLAGIEPAAGDAVDDLLAWDDPDTSSAMSPGAIPAPAAPAASAAAPSASAMPAPAAPAPQGLEAYDTRKQEAPSSSLKSLADVMAEQGAAPEGVRRAVPQKVVMDAPEMPAAEELAAAAKKSAKAAESEEEVSVPSAAVKSAEVKALEARIAKLEKSLEEIGKNTATKSDMATIKKVVLGMQKEVLGFIERNEGRLTGEKTAGHSASSSTAAKGETKASSTPAVLKDWELRSAKHNMAWVSKKGSNTLVALSVGDVFPEIGRVKEVVKDGGRWTVKGEKGIIRQ